jgi:hypothetical protein
MTKVIGALVTAAALTAWAIPPVSAAVLYQDLVRCDFNGNGTFGETDDLGNKKGTVKLFDDGRLTFKMKGLEPDTAYSCRLTCAGNGPTGPNGSDDPADVADCGTTDSHGTANFEVSDFREQGTSQPASSPTSICLGPIFEVFERDQAYPDGGLCKTGFGTGGAGI